jgi:hypothetical protein
VAGTLVGWFDAQIFDANGDPLNAGKIYSYAAGTTTPLATYSDPDLAPGHANANPIVLDAAGRPTSGSIYLAAASYKFVVKNSAGATIKTQDNIAAGAAFNVATDVTGTAGEDIAAGEPVYISDGSGSRTTGRWYRTDADFTYASNLAPAVGMAPVAIASAASGAIRLQGQVTGLSGLVAGTVYYASATAGALTASAPTNARVIGVADSTTTLIVAPAFGSNVALLNALNVFTAFGTQTFTAGGTGGNIVNVINSTAGTGNYGAVFVGNNAAADLARLFALSSTFTPSGPNLASGVNLESTGAGGLSLAATNAAGAVRVYAAGTTETARFDLTSSLQIGGTAARAGTAGTKRVDIFDGTAPTSTLANGCSFYSTTGEMRVMDAAGNATLLSPHDKETNEWIFESVHTPTGKRFRIDMERLVRALDAQLGGGFIHET